MPRFSVVLVEPQTPGNIGAVARLMGNFGFERLYLINPVSIEDEAKKRAMHANDILQEAEIVEDYEELVSNFSMVVGTSGINTENEKKFLRKAETPEKLSRSISDYKGNIALVFGREDKGLNNKELMKCDRLVRIPASKDYPILNLSHAVGIVLYEIFKEKKGEIVQKEDKLSEENERELLIQRFSEILEELRFPEHKYEKTEVMFRKILGRASLTKWEYHRLMGVFSQILKEIEE